MGKPVALVPLAGSLAVSRMGNCVSTAWLRYEQELRGFIASRINDHSQIEDILQDVFIKALAEGNRFCQLDNSRAWLFRVTRNQLIDYQRTHKDHAPIDDQLEENQEESAPVSNLSTCLPFALKNLSLDDQEIIQRCDLDGLPQADYAKQKGLSLTGAKSRIQRARKRLKKQLEISCHIIFDPQGNVCCFGSEKKC